MIPLPCAERLARLWPSAVTMLLVVSVASCRSRANPPASSRPDSASVASPATAPGNPEPDSARLVRTAQAAARRLLLANGSPEALRVLSFRRSGDSVIIGLVPQDPHTRGGGAQVVIRKDSVVGIEQWQ